jgi:hypothetical protein
MRKLLFNGCRSSVWDEKTFWKWTLIIYNLEDVLNMPLNFTLKTS